MIFLPETFDEENNLSYSRLMKTSVLKKTGLIMLGLAACAPAMQAYDFSVGGIYYNYTGDRKGAVVTWASLTEPSYSGKITIPAEVTFRMETLKVKQIDSYAFFNCQGITSVTLPEGITAIGDQAFSHCYAMTSVNLPQTLTRIGDYAFEFCEDMTSITLPKSLTSLGYSVFQECRGLQEIAVDEENPFYKSEDGILYLRFQDQAVLVQYPASKPAGEFTVPDDIQEITDYAFTPSLYLKKITIGPNVTKVIGGTFCECTAMQEFEIADDNAVMSAVDGVLFNKDATTLIQYPLGRADEAYAVPEGTQHLAALSMSNSRLKSVDLPATLTSVGDYALAGSAQLTSVTSRATVPPATGTMAFDNSLLASAVLFVNEDDIPAYSTAAGWSGFSRIRAIGSSALNTVTSATGVSVSGLTVTADGAIRVYDTTGRLVTSGQDTATLPGKGLYIVQANGSTVKLSL